MKKVILIILVISIIVLSGFLPSIIKHHKDRNVVKTEEVDDFLKIPDYTTETIKTIVSPPKPIDTGDVSYWFVVVQKDNGVMMNTIMQQNHKGFSLDEAKAELGGDKAFILNFIQVSKETWDINN
jgi:hypothetical protein